VLHRSTLLLESLRKQDAAIIQVSWGTCCERGGVGLGGAKCRSANKVWPWSWSKYLCFHVDFDHHHQAFWIAVVVVVVIFRSSKVGHCCDRSPRHVTDVVRFVIVVVAPASD
jgi:hypothetical protein